ncbi:MAG: metallophosphoesterase [Sphingomonas bacterium]|nr:metallophosphoesterase [Sphingomonas bacterium]
MQMRFVSGMFGLLRRNKLNAALPDGERIYAVGDIHGEGTLFADLLRRISDDGDGRARARTTLVLLGDFIDRGPDAADLLRSFSGYASAELVILKGNHEAALVASYRGDVEAVDFWRRFGGRSTLSGLGLSQHEIDTLSTAELVIELRKRISPEIIAWLERLPLSWCSGGYFFAHAGIRPGKRLHRQEERDLLWIRDKFLGSKADHGKVVVHGHSVEPGLPELGGNRIGIDTGAHEHGILSALGLEGEDQWIIQASRAHSGLSPVPDRS